MAQITAAVVKALREKTGLPMMDCKNALKEADGDEEAAIEWLRKQGLKTMEKRGGRETTFGRMGLYARLDDEVGAMVELKCESARSHSTKSLWGWPTTWPSNWPKGLAPTLPRICSTSPPPANQA